MAGDVWSTSSVRVERCPWRFAALGSAALVATIMLALAGATLSVAHAEDEPVPTTMFAVADSTVGTEIEAALATVGLDAAWRSETGLHSISRSMTVQYVDDTKATVDAMLGMVHHVRSAVEQHERVEAEVRRAAVDHADARRRHRDTTIERNRAAAHLEGVEALTQRVAVDVFAGHGDNDDELLGIDGQELIVAQRMRQLESHTLAEMLARRDSAIARLDDAELAFADATDDLQRANERHAELVEEAADLLGVRRDVEDRLRRALPSAAQAFVLADVAAIADITPRAIDAYVRAELTMTEQSPGCEISWRTIAAVGGIESAHGTFGGRALTMSGRPDEPITGLRLDGIEVDNYGNTVAAIKDTDGGKWDGDPEYDRAVGPMQFIPQTWKQWGVDADGDGTAEPQDLDDTALAAARYLCAYGAHSDWENWTRAVFAYNRSPAYVNSVQSRLMSMQELHLSEIEGDDLQAGLPLGTFEPLPIPEPDDDGPDSERNDGRSLDQISVSDG